MNTLAGLIDKSMISRTKGRRFKMLRTLREFGADLLQAANEERDTRARYIDYYIDLAERTAGPLRLGSGSSYERGRHQARQMLRAEGLNFSAALNYALDSGCAERVAALTVALADSWLVDGRLRLLKRWVNEALTAGQIPERLRAYLTRAAVFVAFFADADPARAEMLAWRAEAEFQSQGLTVRAWAMRYIAGNALRDQGRFAQARDVLMGMLAEAERVEEVPGGTGIDVQFALGLVYDDLGDTIRAEALLRAYVERCEASGENEELAGGNAHLAAIILNDGRTSEAEALVARALPIIIGTVDGEESEISTDGIDDLLAIAMCKLTFGEARHAKDLLQEAIVRIERSGYRLVLGDAVSALGVAAASLADERRAVELLAAGENERNLTNHAMAGRLLRTLHERAMRLLRASMPAEHFEEAWRCGASAVDVSAFAASR